VALSTLIYNGTVVWTAGYIQGMYYGGRYGDYTYYNTVTRINSSGALVGSETAVGTARSYTGGASVGDYGVYYGGYTGSYSNKVTRINSSGALVGSETAVGTAREYVGGASTN
jgi:hypothetical protein